MNYTEDKVLKRKWINKRVNAAKEGIEFNLTFEEFFLLKEKAGLKTEDLGFTGKGYVLARYNDEGDYSFNNCRFITQSENAKERKQTEKNRLASRANIMKVNNTRTSEELSQQLRNSEKFQTYLKKRKQEAEQKNLEKRKNMHPSYIGKRNSQFGKHWFTNGIETISAYECPNGYYPGRTLKRGSVA